MIEYIDARIDTIIPKISLMRGIDISGIVIKERKVHENTFRS